MLIKWDPPPPGRKASNRTHFRITMIFIVSTQRQRDSPSICADTGSPQSKRFSAKQPFSPTVKVIHSICGINVSCCFYTFCRMNGKEHKRRGKKSNSVKSKLMRWHVLHSLVPHQRSLTSHFDVLLAFAPSFFFPFFAVARFSNRLAEPVDCFLTNARQNNKSRNFINATFISFSFSFSAQRRLRCDANQRAKYFCEQ